MKHSYFSLFLMCHFILCYSVFAHATTSKIDSWDFGAEVLDTALFNNHLTADVINGFYASSITPGSIATTNLMPNFTSDIVSWTGGANDRLRTTNTSVTRYDANVSAISVDGYTFTGRLYVNANGAKDRFLTMLLTEDDVVSIYLKSDATAKIAVVGLSSLGDTIQNELHQIGSTGVRLDFTALQTAAYKIFATDGKPSYYRIFRKKATYTTLSGSIDISNASTIPAGYSVVATNAQGKSWSCVPVNNAYTLQLPDNNSYTLSLKDANGYIITSNTAVNLTAVPTVENLTINQVTLVALTGQIQGLGSYGANLTLKFTPQGSNPYQPIVSVASTGDTYSVPLEANCPYNVVALGVNDFALNIATLTIGSDSSLNLVFTAKPVYNVVINYQNITTQDITTMTVLFKNLNESGYNYQFASTTPIALRDGVYQVVCNGLETKPLVQTLTSNLVVNGADTTKTVKFKGLTNWTFDDQVILNTTSNYKGLLLSGNLYNEIAKGHIIGKTGAQIQVPVTPNQKVIVSYYYSADFSFNGGTPITTNTSSTSTMEYASYNYVEGVDSVVTISVGSSVGSTYICNIEVVDIVAYEPQIQVGSTQPYKTISAALSAIEKMDRPNNERVKILITPGDYEEMLVVKTPNVSFVNAALTPSNELSNYGVTLNANGVRITSYYGHGYNYFSMNKQKWDEETLLVNKENGYISSTNAGAGTTNGSFWNATVVVTASGFEAENIIFENSFNQYVSQKESEDIVQEWESGGKGLRSTTLGDVTVQQRAHVERATALAFADNADKAVLKKCRIIGRQDSFYGGKGVRVALYKGDVWGAVDFIFGPMTAVFYKTDLVMNTSDVSSDQSYITAAQQASGRGFLMYECHVRSTIVGTETASQYASKPGYFGRPWLANTSEVVFYKTQIDSCLFPSSIGASLIEIGGWLNTLSGTSPLCYEYQTIEQALVNNSASRATWATQLTSPTLSDGTSITPFNFTKGSDNWDPITLLIAEDDVETSVAHPSSTDHKITITSKKNTVFIEGIEGESVVSIYGLEGLIAKRIRTCSNTSVSLTNGIWIVSVTSQNKIYSSKVITRE